MNRNKGTEGESGTPLVIRLLGHIEVKCVNQRADRFRSRKGRALLAYLISEERQLHREQLGALLWPDLTLSRARANLSRVLSNLRKVVPNYILADRETVRFDFSRPHQIDTRLFLQQAHDLTATPEAEFDPTAAAEALALYRGELLDGLSLSDCPDFEEWLVIQRERFHRRALGLLDLLIHHHIQRGEFNESRRYVQRALVMEPWREEIHRQGMLIAALQGEREAALQQYDRCRRILAEELDVTPSEETRKLYQRILRGEITSSKENQTVQAVSLPFVGRGTPYAWLLEHWEAACRGQTGLTLVAGEAGIGKTHLVDEVLRHVAGHGATVLRGRCYEFSSTVPYQAINEAVTTHLTAQTDHERLTLPKAVAADLAQLLPVVRRWTSELPPTPQQRGAEARTHLFDSLAYLLRTLPRPVLFIDDLHWADADMLDLLHYLTRTLHRHPIWLVGTYRPEDTPLHHPLTRLRQGLSRDGLIHERALPALTIAEVEQLAQAFVKAQDRPPLAAYLLQQSGGNPFVLQEVLKALQEHGLLRSKDQGWELTAPLETNTLPGRVQDVVMRRVARLSSTAQWALKYAAIIAQPFRAPLLTSIMGTPGDEIETALQSARTHRLLRSAEAQRYDFTHDRIREVLYQKTPDHVRQLMHERVGQTLLGDSTPESLPDDVIAQIAHHFERSTISARAIPYLRQAAQAAQRAYAHETAIDYYRRLLPLLSEEERLPAVTDLVRLWEHLGQWERAETLIRQTLVMVERLEMHAEEAQLWYRLAQIQDDQGRHRASLKSARRAEAAARQAGPEAATTLAMSVNRQGWAYYRLADVDKALPFGKKAVALSRQSNSPDAITDSLNLLSALYNHQGRYADGSDALERALQIYRDVGNQVGESQMLANLGYTAYQRGEYEGAVAYCQEALPLARETNIRYLEMLCLTNLGGAEAAQGRLDQAERHLKQVLDYPESEGWFMLTDVYRYLAEVRLGQRQPEAALTLAQQALSLAREAQAKTYIAAAWRVLAEIGAALPTAPEIEGKSYTPDDGFAQALALYTELTMEGERAWTLWRWGRCLSAKGDSERGTQLQAEARAIAKILKLELEDAQTST